MGSKTREGGAGWALFITNLHVLRKGSPPVRSREHSSFGLYGTGKSWVSIHNIMMTISFNRHLFLNCCSSGWTIVISTEQSKSKGKKKKAMKKKRRRRRRSSIFVLLWHTWLGHTLRWKEKASSINVCQDYRIMGGKKKWSSRKILSKSVLTAEGLTLVTYCGRRLKKSWGLL